MKKGEEKNDYLNNQYKKYEIDSRNCNLEIFEKVTPDTIIGCHYSDGKQVISGIPAILVLCFIIRCMIRCSFW